MRNKLCVLLFGLCLVLISACGNNTAPNNLDNHITSDDEIDMIDDIKSEPEPEQESDQNELDLEELKLMVPDAAEYFKESGEVFSKEMLIVYLEFMIAGMMMSGILTSKP